MSKRISVTLADDVLEELELWASQQGRTTAGLAAFLLESAVHQNRSRINLPDNLTNKLKQLAENKGTDVINIAEDLLIEALKNMD